MGGSILWKTRTKRAAVPRLLSLILAGALVLAGAAEAGGRKSALCGIPAPLNLFAGNRLPREEPSAILEAMRGIPYRQDGALNAKGDYTRFAEQDLRFDTPGLNCSGFVLAASRYLLRRNFTLPEVISDRLNDSGTGSPHGEDWDFGWDLIMNISDAFPRILLLPLRAGADPAAGSGHAPRGYDIHDAATWRELPGRLQPDFLYLVSINVENRRKGYGLQHYHVGLIHVGPQGNAWYYHTTGKGSKVNRRDLKTAAGQASFCRAFANSGGKRKMMLIIEVKLPRGHGAIEGQLSKSSFCPLAASGSLRQEVEYVEYTPPYQNLPFLPGNKNPDF